MTDTETYRKALDIALTDLTITMTEARDYLYSSDYPLAAIGTLLSHDGAPSVEVYDPLRHTVRFAPVRVLASSDERATVAGIAPGTPVVVMGQHEAQPGDDVRTVEL